MKVKENIRLRIWDIEPEILHILNIALSGVVVRPLKMAVFLLFAHPLLDQGLFHLYPVHRTDVPTYLPQAPGPRPQAQLMMYTRGCQRGPKGCALLLVPW